MPTLSKSKNYAGVVYTSGQGVAENFEITALWYLTYYNNYVISKLIRAVDRLCDFLLHKRYSALNNVCMLPIEVCLMALTELYRLLWTKYFLNIAFQNRRFLLLRPFYSISQP